VSTAERTFPLIPRHLVVGHFFGALRSGRRGTGLDVAGSRPYRPGDDIDTIDWGASAKLSSARATDDFVVRVHHADESPCAVVVCDHRPSMAQFGDPFPWLAKREAMRVAAQLVALSVVRIRGVVGYLDYADEGDELWEPPRSRTETWGAADRSRPFRAPGDSLTTALLRLAEHRRAIPPGSFIFMLSDFLVPPSEAALTRALQERWDVVPVIVQDAVWERSFPDVAGVVLRLVDPESGRSRHARLSQRDVEERRAANEERFAQLLEGLHRLDLDPIVLSSAGTEEVLECFMAWSDQRRLLLGRRRI
jgi:uncharacterized protein (DUF58 family)